MAWDIGRGAGAHDRYPIHPFLHPHWIQRGRTVTMPSDTSSTPEASWHKKNSTASPSAMLYRAIFRAPPHSGGGAEASRNPVTRALTLS